jgi:peptidoglycan hydrolase CwlO-like protein
VAESLEIQLAVLKEQVRALRQIVEAAQFLSQSIHDNRARLDVHDERFRDLDHDLAAMEARMETTVSRVEKSCNDLGALIRETSERQRNAEEAQAVMQSKQERDDEDEGHRRDLLLIVASAFATTGIAAIAHLLGLI